MIRVLLLAGLVAGVVVTAPAARADWLVTKDGDRIETQGPWEQRGRLVVFTTAKGDLASMRATELDLDASQAATEAALVPVAPPAPEPVAAPKSVLVITDADVDHVEEATAEGEEEAEEEVSAQDVVVTSWQQSQPPEGNGIAIRGTVRNNGDTVATQVRLMVDVLDREGQSLGNQEAILTSSTLGPAESLSFRVLFPDVQVIDTARFTVTNSAFSTAGTVARKASARAPKPAAGAEADTADDAGQADGADDANGAADADADLPVEDDADFSDQNGLDGGT